METLEILMTLLSISIFAWILTFFEPFRKLLQFFYIDQFSPETLADEPSKLQSILTKLFSCTACLSFWITLILTHSLQSSLICFLIGTILENHMNKNIKIKLP